jgi:CheY-like chemotaxis protein
MTRRILIVDANEAFAMVLRQGLEDMEDTEAKLVSSGSKALRAIASTEYDLVIVDLGLTDVEGHRLVRSLRADYPDLRLVIIPLEGDQVPPELADVPLQGTLSKPFFLPELPDQIEEFFLRPIGEVLAESEEAEVIEETTQEVVEEVVEEEPEEERAPRESAPRTLRRRAEIEREMSTLALEVGAEAVLLTEDSALLAHAGSLPKERIDDLTEAVGESWGTADRIAGILRRDLLEFEQSIGGAEYLLYSLGIVDALVLSVAIAGKISLGMVRHRTRETASAIRGLVR